MNGLSIRARRARFASVQPTQVIPYSQDPLALVVCGELTEWVLSQGQAA